MAQGYLSKTFIITVLILICSCPAFAHRVSVFAYVEGDTVFTESYFSKKRKVHKGKLEIFSTTSGDLLLTGITDNEGLFNFSIPEAAKKEKCGLLINLYASEGHRGTWTLNADEIFPDTADSADQTSSPAPETTAAGITPSSTPEAPSTDIAKLSAQIQELSNKVETMKRLLISQQEKGPGVNEIFSGIGYILGLFGVAAFFLSRKK